MNTDKIYDLIGIGIGPFNLGLAALTHNLSELDCIFIDKNENFNWHPGLMLPTAKMQVPFFADLVTLADPTSPFTYMNYLKSTGKLFRFAINESYFPYRTEYNEYCQWVAAQIPNLHFGHNCTAIHYDETTKTYAVEIENTTSNQTSRIYSKHIVLGIGSIPYVPDCARTLRQPHIFHAADYLTNKYIALMKKHITLIGSGQSAAEIFQDLLQHINNLDSLHWYTRSSRFYSMDYSKFSLELSSPEYISYFYSLPEKQRAKTFSQQHDLYKGINFSLIDEIYQALYLLSLDPQNHKPVIAANTELRKITQANNESLNLHMLQTEARKRFTHITDTVILATGYHSPIPACIEPVRQYIQWDKNNKYLVNENYSIDRNNSLFIQNAESHTHGFNSADLGLGPHRNSIIINTIMKKEIYPTEKALPFQQFSY